jgi:excisionase family DNA binding protein
MEKTGYLTILQLAKILGISRIAVYKRVKKGQIKAIKIGRAYAIPQKQVLTILGKVLAEEDKKQIDAAVKKTVKEYGQVLRLLGAE